MSTYRARVLTVLNASPDWLTAREVSALSGLGYLQTIYALNALHNAELIARSGRKSTARWGSIVLVEHDPSADAIKTLEAIFHAIRRNHPYSSGPDR